MPVKRGGGPGTYETNGVRCTMDAPFPKAAGQKSGVGGGIDGRNKAPFDKPQSMGNGGIPTKFFDGMSSKAATRTPAPGQVAPSQQGGKREGTEEYPYGGKMSDGRKR